MRSRETKPFLSDPTDLPSGVCVITENGKFFINGKVRLRITSSRVSDSWSFPITIYAMETALSRYPLAGTLGFRDGTLIKNILDAKMYIISKSARRPVANPDVLDNLNLQEKNAILVSDTECNLHKLGEPLN